MEYIVSIELLLGLVWFSLIGFYGISTLVAYLMPNPIKIFIDFSCTLSTYDF